LHVAYLAKILHQALFSNYQRSDEMIDVIVLGQVEVVFRPTGAVDAGGLGSANVKYQPRIATPQEAESQLGWKLLHPTFLPFADMMLERVFLSGEGENLDSAVTKYSDNSGNWLVLRQEIIRDCLHCRRIPIPYLLRSSTVNNQPAALYEHTVTARSLPDGQLRLLCCLWEHGNFLVELEAPYISEQVAMQVAGSLR
jgi:hypothetical protein